MSHSTSQKSDNVLEFLCDRRFHRQFTFTQSKKRYRVSYSDYGSITSKSVVLFFGGLMGGRLSYSPLDQLAKSHNIRIIHPDRPGIGGKRPYVAFFAPWVHPSHSGIKHLQAAELLPASMIGKFSSLAKFVNGTITPLTGMSTGLSSTVSNALKSSLPQFVVPEVPIPLEPIPGDERPNESDKSNLDLNDAAVVEGLRSLIPTFLFAEAVNGVGQDAQLCLRKPRSIPWSTPSRHWEDIDDAVRQLEHSIHEGEDESQEWRVWMVDAFHAETDSMVGEKGRVWFDACWMRDEAATSNSQDVFEYNSQVMKGSDHDFILDPVFGASEAWLKRVSESFGGGAVDEVVVSSP
ncbi:hypothetical protein BU25DRAFT_390906 [Macroventuria anomochaeta]|uniref:Uncharacterized protein n=1 Tax=Macroventuria anomochaeta TaxID=301207 RepID=A0ACB6S2F8_9PLEO|nr:uncharacterized protein BU25DRAFT_390906 [Macroventuria anomochaeta]KAF2628336.1 hypothetical protein BU25DRAFT_390906 [Macroventuria anomochaeta]